MVIKSQAEIRKQARMLLEHYYNLDNSTNLKTVLTIIELVESLKTYDNKPQIEDVV